MKFRIKHDGQGIRAEGETNDDLLKLSCFNYGHVLNTEDNRGHWFNARDFAREIAKVYSTDNEQNAAVVAHLERVKDAEDYKPLKEHLPHEFMGCEYDKARARKFADVMVTRKHESGENCEPWPGTHKNVFVWFVLENGYAVALNENPSIGWSFPVVKLKPKQSK